MGVKRLFSYVDFKTEPNNDYLTIYKGESIAAKMLCRLSGNKEYDSVSGKLVDSWNWVNAKSLYVTFSADRRLVRKGFKIFLQSTGKLTESLHCNVWLK